MKIQTFAPRLLFLLQISNAAILQKNAILVVKRMQRSLPILNFSMINKTLNSFLLFSIFIISTTSLFAQSKNVLGDKFKLLPVPKQIELVQGFPLSYNDLTSFRLEGTDKKPVLDESLNILKVTSAKGKGTVVFKLDSASSPDSPEGYILEIRNGYVNITARKKAGLFYGAQTL